MIKHTSEPSTSTVVSEESFERTEDSFTIEAELISSFLRAIL